MSRRRDLFRGHGALYGVGWVMIALVVSLSACDSPFGPDKNTFTLSLITAGDEGGTFLVRFALWKNDKPTAQDGRAQIWIENKERETVYSGNFPFAKEDFKDVRLMFTNERVKAVEIAIPIDEIEKSRSFGGLGTLYLKLTLSNGASFETTNLPVFGLPTFSQEELEALDESRYISTSTIIDSTLIEHPFEITLERAGAFTLSSTVLGDEHFFRIDLRIKNVSTELEGFFLSNVALVDALGNQYSQSLFPRGTLESITTIQPGATVRGSVLFEPLHENVQGVSLRYGFNGAHIDFDIQ